MGRISRAFDTANSENRAAFIPYMTAGFPDKTTFLKNAETLLEVADILEIGLPYSDPLGDGPTIQRSSERALKAGTTTAEVFDMIAVLRERSDKPLVLMTYYNPIYCYKAGERGFVNDLKAAGADGVILPDLPPDEADTLLPFAREADLDTIFLVAPTSTDERLKRVSADCRGFIYAVSITGVTGARSSLPTEVPELLRRVRSVSDLPVAVGFGVSNEETAQSVAAIADGVVVGSALVKAAEDAAEFRELAQRLGHACRKAGDRP